MPRKAKYSSRKSKKTVKRAYRKQNTLYKSSNICNRPITTFKVETVTFANASDGTPSRVIECAFAPTAIVQSNKQYLNMAKMFDSFRFRSVTFRVELFDISQSMAGSPAVTKVNDMDPCGVVLACDNNNVSTPEQSWIGYSANQVGAGGSDGLYNVA